jgi:cyclopropane fatty-acyl-phospholipid synthase-like methyltransferase
MLHFFETAYRVGFTPWDREATVMGGKLQALADRGELDPPGCGLDIGCGTGRHSVSLAERGWTMTGIDFSEQALKKARARPVAPGAKVEFIRGDVTKLDQHGITGPFDLLLDAGCFHSLPDRRPDYVAGLRKVAAPNARYLLLALGPSVNPSMPTGATREEIERTFTPDWEIVHAEDIVMKGRAEGEAASWYHFRRKR